MTAESLNQPSMKEQWSSRTGDFSTSCSRMSPQKSHGYDSWKCVFSLKFIVLAHCWHRASLVERQKLQRKRDEAREWMRKLVPFINTILSTKSSVRRCQEIKNLDAATQSALKKAAHASQAKYRQKNRFTLAKKEADRRLTCVFSSCLGVIDWPTYTVRICISGSIALTICPTITTVLVPFNTLRTIL